MVSAKIMLNSKQTFSSKIFSHKSKQVFSYELFFGLVTFLFLLVSLIMQLVAVLKHAQLHLDYNHPQKNPPDQNHLQYLKLSGWIVVEQFFSYFTIQTNLLCASILVLSAVAPRLLGKSKLLRPNFVLAVSVYITIASILFNTFLIPDLVLQDKINRFFPWLLLTWEHTILPVAFVCWFIFLYSVRTPIVVWQHKKSWFHKLFIYPKIYILVLFLRGVFLRDMVLNTTLGTSKKLIFFQGTNNNNHLFLYYMLNVFDSNFGVPGYAWFLIAVVVQANILVWGTYLYQKAFNKWTPKQKAIQAKVSKRK